MNKKLIISTTVDRMLKDDDIRSIESIDISKTSIPSDLLDISLQLKCIHTKLFDNVSITTILKSLVENNIKFTLLEKQIIDKILVFITTDEFEPISDVLSLNSTSLIFLTKALKEQKDVSNLSYYDNPLIKSSISLNNEIDNLLIGRGVKTYYYTLTLVMALVVNINKRLM